MKSHNKNKGKKDMRNQSRGFRPQSGFKVKKPPGALEHTPDWPIRLNKFIAHCGLCSRREAADWVKSGKVWVNGIQILEPGFTVQQSDQVTVDGKPVKLEDKKVYFLLNKPKDYITTLKDEKGRKTVMDIFKNKVKERIYPVGRLDRHTTGLLLFTNDGDLAKKLSHPSGNVSKVYHVTLDKIVTEEHFTKIRAGLTLEDGVTEVDAVNYMAENGPLNEVGIEIHSGKNRIVRRIFEHLGFEVIKLDRIYFAGLTKKDLPRGRFRPLTDREIIMLKHFTK